MAEEEKKIIVDEDWKQEAKREKEVLAAKEKAEKEEEDVKEEMLLYALLARGPLERSELEEAREAIELFLWDEFSVAVEFDVHDALQRLLKEGLVREDDRGVLTTMPPRDGIAHLQAKWAAHLSERPASADVSNDAVAA